jgi:uncharacterized protein (DUF433 family)
MPATRLQFNPSEAAFIADVTVREVQKAFDEDWFDTAPRYEIHGATRRFLGPAELLHLRLMKDTCTYAIFPTAAKKLIHRQLRERMVDFLFLRADDSVVLVECKHHARSASDVAAYREYFERLVAAHDTSDKMSDLKQLFPKDWQRLVVGIHQDEWDRRLQSCFEQVTESLKEPVKISDISVDAVSSWEGMTERLAAATAAHFAVVSDAEIRGGEPVVRGTRIPVYLLQDLVAQGAGPNELLADYPSLDEQRLRLALLYAQNHPRQGRPRKRPWLPSVAE